VASVRGNVETRVRKALDQQSDGGSGGDGFDGVVLAAGSYWALLTILS